MHLAESVVPIANKLYDQRLIETAKVILKMGSVAVSKPVRAGFTTSAVMACEQEGRRLLIVAPTRRILKETIKDASSETVRIPGNSECPRFAEDLKKHPILYKLPLTLPNCEKCNLSSWCEIRDILRNPDPRIMALTYAKLEALMLSNGAVAEEVKAKIGRAEVTIFDEAHVISVPSVVSVRAFQTLVIPAEYSALVQAYVRWLELCQRYVATVQELMQEAEQNHASKHLARSVFNTNPQDWQGLKIAWSQLIELAKEHILPDEDILQLRDIITLIGATALSVNYVGIESDAEEDAKGAVYLSTMQTRQWQGLREFLINRQAGSSVIFGSATLFEPYAGFFSDLVGAEVRQTIFPDLRNATQKMQLIPDTWKLGAYNFRDRLPQIVATIKAIAEREKQQIYVLAPNIKKAAILKKELAEAGIKGVNIDYYNSDGTLGVERKDRVCIAVGLAEIPANAYDRMARGATPEERFLDSRKLRQLSVDASTWQAVNRVRDPSGTKESRVYFIGVRLDQVKQVATWGTNRRLELVEVHEIKNSISNISRTAEFKVNVDIAIETPRIQGEIKTSDNTRCRSVKDYVDKIELNCIISENPDKVPTNIYGENIRIFRIYNFPHDINEIIETSDALYKMFANRTDCFAQQYHNHKSGKWEFCKVLSPLTETVIKKHVDGEITIGTYEIGLDDMVTWCCDDIDSHNGESDSREKVIRVITVLWFHGIPFLLEASGSMDSYHIWILLAPTKTYNAYRFIRQINSEAKVDCECWPKQKSLKDKNGKYGNLVKLPICFHQKSGGRSAFLDPDTFEPLEGPIEHPGLVHLRVSKN